jgi:hypothetical protein
MPLLLRFGFAAQIIAAFVIFVLGYLGLFVSLLIVLFVVKGLYEGAKWIQSSAARRGTIPCLQPVNSGPRAAPAVYPALNRRRVAVNYSSYHSGGAPL